MIANMTAHARKKKKYLHQKFFSYFGTRGIPTSWENALSIYMYNISMCRIDLRQSENVEEHYFFLILPCKLSVIWRRHKIEKGIMLFNVFTLSTFGFTFRRTAWSSNICHCVIRLEIKAIGTRFFGRHDFSVGTIFRTEFLARANKNAEF